MITKETTGCSKEFAAFLSSPREKRELYLSNCTLIECIRERIKVKQRASPRFGKGYSSLLKSLKELEKSSGVTLYPSHVNEIFWSFFIPFLENNYKSRNSIRTMIAQLKCSLSWCSNFGAEITTSYNECVAPVVETKFYALTADDVSCIYHMDIDSIPVRPQHKRTLVRVKDMFCLMCNIGLRFSDARRLTKDHFDNDCIHILQQKTKRYAHIDVPTMCIHRKMVYEILDRYNYTAPYNHDNTEFNKRLHELLLYCKFNEDYRTEIIINGEVHVKTMPKYKVITSHSARRTFVVYNAENGVSDLAIKRATGHKTSAALDKYLCYHDCGRKKELTRA